jgi:hypothetical protein
MANTLTAEIIHAAIDGYEAQKARIDEKIAGLRAMLPVGSVETASPSAAPTGKRRRISAASRARMAEAQRKRWAAKRAQVTHPKSTGVKKVSTARKKVGG